MAKKSEETVAAPKKVSSFFNSLRKATNSTSFAESKFAKPDHYIDTGNFALNRIYSGSVFGGIPSGIIMILGGGTASGKSLQACILAKNAINQNNYDAILYFDAEGGAPLEMMQNVGVDTNKVEHILVESAEDCTVKLLATYKKIMEFKETNPDFKALLILDSLGALVPNKLINDADNGKQVQDMGSFAKLCNNMIKGCTVPALKTQCTLIVLNHVYDDPGAFMPTKLKQQRGGRGLQYMASLAVQCDRRLEKGSASDEGFYETTVLKFFTTKNRGGCRPFLETEVPLSFTRGFEGTEYYGLIPVAIQLGFIKNPKQGYYQVPTWSDKMLRLKELEGGPKAKEIWDTFIKDFDEASKKQISYSSMSEVEQLLAQKEDSEIAEELGAEVVPLNEDND